jgi:hydroxymethylbilane synthase
MSQPARHLRLATRGSVLAVAQSRQVAAALMASDPGLEVTLKLITTRGDRNLSTPLQSVADADFFSAEIDQAILAGEAEFAVHSRKDLNKRPTGLITAAMPARANPRDVILFRAETPARLRAGKPIRIGSSSARREVNVRRFLRTALPRLGPDPRLTFRSLRGPVEQRIEHLHADPDSPDGLDAVVIALAGLERLWADADGRCVLQPLLSGLRWMLPPLSECPAAPGQGALVLECRAGDRKVAATLAKLNDAATATAVAAEFGAIAQTNPAIDSTLGATAITVPDLGTVIFARSREPANSAALNWMQPEAPALARGWDGAAWTRACQRRHLPVAVENVRQPALFIAHWHALGSNSPKLENHRIWVSGLTSWQQLASLGIWVEGCADGLGFDALRDTLSTSVLQLPTLKNWAVLTRSGAEESWANSGLGQIVATYVLETPADSALTQIRATARQATHFFWGSREQYLALRDCLPSKAEHACGSGKTLQALRDMGEQPRVFPNREAWRTWVD